MASTAPPKKSTTPSCPPPTSSSPSTTNTPHQLLALQRLADFPARAEYREQSAAIRAERLDLARSKEKRAQEMHTHKIALDLRKQDHKEKTAAFSQQLALDRRSTLARNPNRPQFAERTSYSGKHSSGGLGKPNPNLFFGSNCDLDNPNPSSVSVADNSARPKTKILVDEDGEPFVHRPGPCPLPEDVIIKNRAYAKKLLAGLIDPVTGEELPDASSPSSSGGTSRARSAELVPVLASGSPTSISRDAISNHGANPADNAAQLQSVENPDNPVHPVQNLSALSASSAGSSSIPIANPPMDPEELAARVDRYTVNRIREYITHNQNHTPWPYRHPAPEFITEERHCPCGQPCPCPTHETIPDVGPFPPIFWKKSPFDAAYAECLRDRNLPFRRPDEFLP